jgi:mannose-6-phosphate isomerase-like protein (cupin superfamily)
MVKYIVEQEVEGDIFEEPFARTIKHLAAPWTLGSKKLWLGTDEIQPHNSSNAHFHDDQEEVFFFLSGKGRVKVDEEEIEVGPGYCVLLPMGSVHQVFNDGDTVLRFVAAVSPPFIPEKFKADHLLKKDN